MIEDIREVAERVRLVGRCWNNFVQVDEKTERVHRSLTTQASGEAMTICIRRSAVFLLFTGGLIGCSGISPQERQAYDSEQARLRANPMAMVVDGCILRNEIGSSYLLRQDSVEKMAKVAGLSRSYLAQHGLAGLRVRQPFICGAPWFDAKSRPQFMADNKKTDPQPLQQLPVELTDSVRQDAQLAGAYQQLFLDAAKQLAEGASLPVTTHLSEAQASSLVRDTGAKRLWVLSLAGTDVSAGKSLGMGMLTGVATVATFGIGVVVVPTDGYSYHVALVDLDRRRITWRKSVIRGPGNPGDADTFDHEWVASVFTPFLDIEAVAWDENTPAVPAPAEVATAPAAPVAATTAALAATTPVTAPSVLVLRAQPKRDARVLGALPPGPLRCQSITRNTEGRWCLMNDATAMGWILQE